MSFIMTAHNTFSPPPTKKTVDPPFNPFFDRANTTHEYDKSG